MLRRSRESTIDRFRLLHSEIIEYYQCIEFDMRRIYSAMHTGRFEKHMDEMSDKSWGEILNMLRDLDNSDGNPYFSKEEYKTLNKMRARRNYWCHQCYLDFVYTEDDWERAAELESILQALENEHHMARKISNKLEELYLQDFAN